MTGFVKVGSHSVSYRKSMIKNVLVVGGAGYIGGCVTDALAWKKIPFTVLDNLTYENHYLKPVPFIYGDVRNKTLLKKILPRYSHVIWLAAIVGDGACAIRPEITKSVNQNAVGWLAKNYNGKIIFTSTCSVYGVSKGPVTETSPVNPLSVYAKTKLQAEKYLSGKKAMIFRLGTAYGISDSYSRIRMDLAINYMTMNAIAHKKLTIYGGKQWRPFIHVKDIGQTVVAVLDERLAGTYNLATQNATILEIAKVIKSQTKCTIEITDQKFQDDQSYNAITTKARADRIMSSVKKHTITFGVSEVKDLVLSHRIKNLDLELYSNEKFLLQAIRDYEKIN